MNNVNPFLRAAAQQIQIQQFDQARNILTGVLNQNPNDPDAWYLMATTMDAPKEIAYCLRQALKIQPDHADACNGIAHLEEDVNLIPLQVMVTDRESAAIGGHCPFCGSGFAVTEKVVVCPVCSATYHQVCWADNGFGCAIRLCGGFSLREIVSDPIPVQPPRPESKMVVVQKEDIPQVNVETRQKQEEPFLRKILLLKLLQEDGVLSRDQLAGLSDVNVDQLLEQYLRDRDPDTEKHRETSTNSISMNEKAEPMDPSALRFCVYCGNVYPREISKYCSFCGKPRV